MQMNADRHLPRRHGDTENEATERESAESRVIAGIERNQCGNSPSKHLVCLASKSSQAAEQRGGAMKKTISVTVNGVTHQNEVEPRLLLVQYIRDVLNLTGTHVGCETSLCGACTVMVDGQAIKSCTMLAAHADGSTVTTIEGLAQGGEH